MFIEKLNEEKITELFLGGNRVADSIMFCRLSGRAFWNILYHTESRKGTWHPFALIVTDFEVYFRSAGDGIHVSKQILDEENTLKLREYLAQQYETYQSLLDEQLNLDNITM